MALFLSIKKILLLSCSIVTCSLMSDGVFGADDKENHTPNDALWAQGIQGPKILAEKPSEALKTLYLSEKSLRKPPSKNRSNTGLSATTRSAEELVNCVPNKKLITPRELMVLRSAAARLSELERLREAAAEQQPERIEIPLIARDHEDIYERFMAGSLVYSPTEGSTVGQIVMPIASIANPNTLEGTFDLSRCGDVGRYISIATGYRKGKISANKDKLEIWITPRFLIQSGITGQGAHYAGIINIWNAPVGLIWTWGNWAANDGDCDYLTCKGFSEISLKNLNLNQYESSLTPGIAAHNAIHAYPKYIPRARDTSHFTLNFNPADKPGQSDLCAVERNRKVK